MMYVYSIKKKTNKTNPSTVSFYISSHTWIQNYVHKIILTCREVTKYYICVYFIWYAASPEVVMIKDQQLHRQGLSFTVIELL